MNEVQAGSENLAPEDQAIMGAEHLACAKCGAPITGKQGWCRRCGWYPLLKTFVELDAWEQPAQATDIRAELRSNEFQRFRNRFLFHAPAWAWKLMGGVAVILAISILARILLPAEGPYRLVWSIAQIVVGLIVFLVGHVLCYMFAIVENDRLTVLDIMLKPVTIWIAAARELPLTFWRVAAAVWGFDAILCGILVGGFDQKSFLDWGGEPARPRLVQAIVAHAREENSDKKGGEGALGALAGKGGLTPKDDMAPKTKEIVDCLIIGFEPLGDDDFNSLILAAEVAGKLQYVGTVRNGIPPEVRIQLNQQMRTLVRPVPFVQTRIEGVWVKPALLCRVSAIGWSPTEKLVEPTFVQMLTDIGAFFSH